MTIRERPLADPREVIVVQPQLLDLMVRRERDPVSMDAVTRAALIDLMARVPRRALRSCHGTGA